MEHVPGTRSGVSATERPSRFYMVRKKKEKEKEGKEGFLDRCSEGSTDSKHLNFDDYCFYSRACMLIDEEKKRAYLGTYQQPNSPSYAKDSF